MFDPGKKIPKKIGKKFKKLKKKNYFTQNLQPKWDEIGREREKKILVPNSVPTKPGKENSKKILKIRKQDSPEKNSKKIQKTKKPLFGIIFSQNGMRQAEKGRKKFQSRIPLILDPGKKIPKEIAKKFKNLKKPLSGIIFIQNGMRQAEKRRKKFQSRIQFILDHGKKIPKKQEKNSKNQKTSFRKYFQPKRDEIGWEREKKILGPNSVDSGPRKENSEKNSKKIQKIKKPLFGTIFSQNGTRQAEKRRKKFQSRIPFIFDTGKKIPKKIVKKFKKL